jgi:hypothetical protein
MKLMRSAVLATVAKKVYDEARKPQNQARIKQAVAKVQARRSGGATGTTARSTERPR